MQKLLLFDIDGTILNSGGAGKRAMVRAFEEVWGVSDGFRGIHMSGKTDPFILRQALEQAGLATDKTKTEAFKSRYFELLSIEIEKPNAFKKLMPGILALIRHLHEEPTVELGLLTGNWRRGAELKLGHFGLFGFFKVGAFGDDSEDRNQLLPFALKRFAEQNGSPLPIENVYVIGDTPRDVQSAQPYGAKTVAIATGTYSLDQLRAESPDFLFPDLKNWQHFLQILKN